MHPAIETIARIARVDVGMLAPETVLGTLGLGTSLGLSVLQSALERQCGRRLSALAWTMTIGEVMAAVDGGEPAVAPVVPPTTAAGVDLPEQTKASGPFGGRTRLVATPAALGHGVDLQEIVALPAIDGGFADPFYQQNFTAGELAGATGRADARIHLCGLWCAKEAVRKAEPVFFALRASEIVIEHAADGRPLVRIERPELHARFSIALSISHSGAYAIASAITLRR